MKFIGVIIGVLVLTVFGVFTAASIHADGPPLFNVHHGFEALYSNTTGSINTALGDKTLHQNTVGEGSTAVGYAALYANTEGHHNVAVGVTALRNNTIGNYNVGVGVDTLYRSTTGSFNTAMSYSALHNNTTGDGNTAIGYRANWQNTTGSQNVAVGAYAGRENTTGNQNTWIGYEAGLGSPATIDNSTAIGYQVKATKSNQVVIGNGNIEETAIGGVVMLSEQLAPPAPAADTLLLYARDNGSGKTQLCVLFATGAEQCLATQP